MQEQIVAFQLADQVYGLDINSVREIIRLQPVMVIPESPGFIAGLISLRDKVIPVIDLRQRFGFPPGEEEASSRIIILDLNQTMVGVKVDAVLEVLRLEEKDIETIPSIAIGIDTYFLRGVGTWQGKLVLLLNGATLITKNEEISFIDSLGE